MAMTRTNPHRMTRKPPDRGVKGEVVVQVGPVRMPPAPERDGQPRQRNRPHRRATTDATKRNPRSRSAASGLPSNASAASNLAPMMPHPAGQWSLPARLRLSDALRCPPRIIAASERAKMRAITAPARSTPKVWGLRGSVRPWHREQTARPQQRVRLSPAHRVSRRQLAR